MHPLLAKAQIGSIERDQSWKGSLVCSPWKVRQGRRLWGRGGLGRERRSRGGGRTQLWGWQSACERERCQIQKKRKGQPSEGPRRVYPRMWLTLSVSASDIPEADREGVEKRWQGPAVHELFTDARHVFICCGFQGHHLLFRVGCWRELSPHKGTTHSKKKISPMYDAPLCRWRLFVTFSKLHNGKEFHPPSGRSRTQE